MLRSRILSFFVVGLFAIFSTVCGGQKGGEPLPSDLPVHTLVFGGDVFLGGGISRAFYNEGEWPLVFGNVSDLMRRADLTFVNAEGVISGGGLFAYKEDRAPLCYRAHPNAAHVLAEAGVDIATVGNNHGGDYGTAAFVEMLDRLSAAGIDYTGGGYTQEDARTPSVRLVGDTGLAIVGADMTSTKSFAAKRNTPGTLFFAHAAAGKNLDAAVDVLKRIEEKTRAAADVILFSPHWGHNWQKAPTKHLRTLAERLIEAGYDGILGHSAHLYHGVELIDGKPVIYDAGNLLLNYGPRPGDHGEHRSVLYEIQFTRAGITQLVAHPLALNRNSVRPAEGKVANEILSVLATRSKAFDTDVTIQDGTAVIACNPGAHRGPKTAEAVKKKPWKGPVREAPSYMHVEKLPDNAVPLKVRFENGITLLGYRMLTDHLLSKRPAQVIETYWTRGDNVTADDNLLIHMEAQTERPNGVKKNFSGHQPGDWILPVAAWPKGGIIRDITYFRLTLSPGAPVRFYTGLWTGGRFVKVSDIEDPVRNDDGRILLGTADFTVDAPGVFDLFEQLRSELSQ